VLDCKRVHLLLAGNRVCMDFRNIICPVSQCTDNRSDNFAATAKAGSCFCHVCKLDANSEVVSRLDESEGSLRFDTASDASLACILSVRFGC
jgi:hypothetical protein